MPSKHWAVALAVLLVVGGLPGIGAAQSSEEPLRDGSTYWAGTTLVAEDFAPDAGEAELYEGDGTLVRSIALNGGDLQIDTTDLRGGYYVTAPGVDRVRFEIAEQQLGLDVSVTRTAGGPPYVVAEVSVSSNRGGTEIHVSAFDDFADYVNGDVERVNDDTVAVEQSGGFTVGLDHLAGEDTTISAEDPDTGVYENDIFDIPPITPPPGNAQPVTAERGGEYWAGDTLAFESATIHEFYSVETVSGQEVATQQAATDGSLYVNTTGYEAGAYRILNDSGAELTRFGVDVQELSASIEAETLLLESNRDGYNATISVSNASTNVTAEVFNRTNGTTASFEALDGEAQIPLRTDHLNPGQYTVYVESESGVNASTSFTIAQPTPTPTPTPTATPTATSTSTATSSPTLTSTATERGSPTMTNVPTEIPTGSPTPSSETETTSPGFGVLISLVVIVATGLLAREAEK